LSVVETVGLIEAAMALLLRHLMIGRPIEFGRDALLISRGRTGYLAF